MSHFKHLTTRASVRALTLAAMVGVSGCAGLSDASTPSANAPYQVAGQAQNRATAHVRSDYYCDGGQSGFVDSCSPFARLE